jgi:hypothetical protein
MATVGTSVTTLADLAKAMDPMGSIAPIAELLAQTNEIVGDIPMVEGNLPTGHRGTLRTSLPTVGFRRFNEGVLPVKTTRGQIDFQTCMMETYAQFDKALVKLYGNQGGAYMASERVGIVEALNQQFASTLFTGDTSSDPATINGFATLLNDVNIGESASAVKDGAVVDAGGSGADNTSIYLIGWSPRTVFGIYPKGTQAGLQQEDLGEDTAVSSTGAMYQVLRQHFVWNWGLAVEDWRYCIRIANIDASDVIGLSGTQNAYQLLNSLVRALERRPVNTAPANWVFYCNRQVRTAMRLMSRDKAGYSITIDMVAGKQQVSFDGVPIRIVDKIGIAEAQLT